MLKKPMLACEAPPPEELKYPLLASPKLDGVRATVQNSVVYSRTHKPIPNKLVQECLGQLADGLDGELIVGSPTAPDCFNVTSGAVRRRDGEPPVTFYTFDFVPPNLGPRPLGFKDRLSLLKDYVAETNPDGVVVLQHKLIHNPQELLDHEEKMLTLGYEGLILRDPDGPYKEGRSTQREGWMLKLKRFTDSEGVVLGFEEEMQNTNEQKVNELGKLRRSGHKEGKVGKGTLGGLVIRDLKTGVVSRVGSGFTAEQRAAYWKRPEELLGKIVKYKFFAVGVVDRPRHPVFLGFREAWDM